MAPISARSTKAAVSRQSVSVSRDPAPTTTANSQSLTPLPEVRLDTITADPYPPPSLSKDTLPPSHTAWHPARLPDDQIAYLNRQDAPVGRSLAERGTDGASGGSGPNALQWALMVGGGVATVGMFGLIGHMAHEHHRDRKKAALSQSQREEAREPTEANSRAPPEPAVTEADSQEPTEPAPTASYAQAPTELDQGMTGELLIEGGSGTNRRSFPEEWRLSQGQPPIELDDMAPKRPKGVYQQIK